MCGRYTLRTPVDTLAEQFDLDEYPSSLTASYNVAPTQEVATVVEEDDKRKLEMFHWGLIPSWAKDPQIGNRMINARAETVHEKPSFRSAFKDRRCLILADGFYEWQKTDNGKQPFYIHMKDGSPFAFAGLWETWKNGEELRSCAIITTDAVWLDPDFDEKDPLKDLLKPFPSEEMEAYMVSRRVNKPSNNEPSVVEPAA